MCMQKCKNGCRKLQTCVCKNGFRGTRCQHQSFPGKSETGIPKADVVIQFTMVPTLTPAISTAGSTVNTDVSTAELKYSDPKVQIHSDKSKTSLRWQPLSLQELQSILKRKGLASHGKITSLLTTHLETQKRLIGNNGEKEKHYANKTIHTPRKEYMNHKQIHKAVVCPLLCQNGGVCLKKDKCLCTPNFTGKFCQIPVSPDGWNSKQDHKNSSVEQNTMTKSVHTLPLANYHPEKDGTASIVKVHVEHPPEASVNIHQVERIDRHSGHIVRNQNHEQQDTRIPLFRVQAQNSPRINGYTENSGFGYCFRRLENGQCASPIPGLRTQEICCRSSGVAWGVHDCTPCNGHQGDVLSVTVIDTPCPKGFERVNGTCTDIDECTDSTLCVNGDCTNTRGSYTCMCREGYLLDSSRSSCISHHVISEVKGPCFRILRDEKCSLPILRNITKQICCCSRVGKAWGKGCEQCPPFGTEGFKEACPAGPGYHYSASDLRINTRYVGQDQARVPLLRQPASRGFLFTTTSPIYHAVTGHITVVDRQQDTDQSKITTPIQRVPAREPVSANRSISGPDRVSPLPAPVPTETQREAPTQESSVCELNPQICGPGRCVPRSGSYTCVCNTGYWLSTQGTHCIDMDECRQRPSLCTNGRCENTVGSYRCACSAGFSTNPQGTDCTDIDECRTEQHLCDNGRCENMPGSYRCICSPGFTLNPQGKSCIDIDECRLSPRRFCLSGQCENTPGSFLCICPAGYTANPQGTDCQDTDECRQTPRICGSGRCQNTPGSFRCSCPIGYRLTPQGNDCIDINECENPGACAGQECLNTPGSFQCRQCRSGYKLQNRRCVDINECQTESACGLHGKCINTEGSFECECHPGYRLNDRNRCTDINECLEGEFCFPRGECQNTEGSYTCVCAEGYVTTPDGASCVDKDECQQGTLCQGGRCTNTQGSFQCQCPTGFRATSNKAACTDIDECQERGTSLCGAQSCENTLGSYRCIAQCDTGYRLTASGDCEDINECANSTICGDNAVCQNLLGSYRCTCNWGHEMSSEGQHCIDVDECLEYGRSICGNKRCENTPGTYRCISDCEPGYLLSPSGDCTDVNECLTLQGVCGTAICENVEGSFLCTCPNSKEEFDPMSGKCIRSNSTVRPVLPSHPRTAQVDTLTSSHKECYYNLEESEVCGNVLARNVSQDECCCSIGEGWGQNCEFQKCPTIGTVEYQALCPQGGGYTTSEQGLKDINECQIFGTQLCKGGFCVNKIPSFSCYCSNGYYYDVQRLECVDNDECHEEDLCVGGNCINTVGSYYCTCNPPLVLDSTQRRCITNTSQAIDENLSYCWQEIGADLLCRRPLLERQTTYTECCCQYGEAWGLNCALCPGRDTDDLESLCIDWRSPEAENPGPPQPSLYDYGTEYGGYGVPYGPDTFANPPPRIVRPGYDSYPASPGGMSFGSRPALPYGPRDSLYSLPPYESPDFDSDIYYPDPSIEEPRNPFQRTDSPHDPRLYPSVPRSRLRSPDISPRFELEAGGRRVQPRRPGSRDPGSVSSISSWRGDPREAFDDRYEQFEGLQAEECGILNGCENGRCIRVPEGYTCDCYDGYRLDITLMACTDINECDEAEDLSILCLNGQCRNTDGSYECVCPRGYVLSRHHNYCLPIQQ
ncbi:latent-transforming growth factor beta-binding protein 4 isoform X2 [Xenopus laevis]|uniref:Latent-transforming growth factor beta-binding protein 4 n=1 Tax=Xenopus laevis TaxID=8355 RepID=A0A8J1LHP4_XENLA|nr:latent-transforming growth factor beta-binding protein 4 isoform X2 [Xenopus laevis]